MRATTLAHQNKGDGPFIPLKDLVGSDDWLRQGNEGTILVGYAQSWALYRMLMEDRPDALRKYLVMIYPRRTPDHRLADFVECFGNIESLDVRFHAYIKEVVQQQAKPGK
jgi:hypothetical protein